MKSEELAFFNQQLAGMLKSGVPLEGALAEVSRDLGKGSLKNEAQQLEKDLSNGTDLADGIKQRAFPLLYKRLIELGARTGRLDEMLILLADHYHRSSLLWNRFRGLMVYPLVVLLTACCVSTFLAYSFTNLYSAFTSGLGDYYGPNSPLMDPSLYKILIIVSPLTFAAMLTIVFSVLLVPPLREAAGWRFPGWREAHLAQTSAACSVLIKSGLSLGETIKLMNDLEPYTQARSDLTQWHQRLEAGESNFANLAKDSRAFPPLFVWLIASSGEAIADGFEKAADLYTRRAEYRSELFLSAAVPVSLLFTVSLLILQIFPMIRALTGALTILGGF